MEQLRCEFFFEPTPELERLGAEQLWSFDMELEDWVEQVEQLRSFRAAIGRVPLEVTVAQERV